MHEVSKMLHFCYKVRAVMINNNGKQHEKHVLSLSFAFFRRSFARLILILRVGIFLSLDLSFELILINNFSSPYASSCLPLSLSLRCTPPSSTFSRAKHKEFKYATCTYINAGRWSKRLNRPQTCSVVGRRGNCTRNTPINCGRYA